MGFVERVNNRRFEELGCKTLLEKLKAVAQVKNVDGEYVFIWSIVNDGDKLIKVIFNLNDEYIEKSADEVEDYVVF